MCAPHLNNHLTTGYMKLVFSICCPDWNLFLLELNRDMKVPTRNRGKSEMFLEGIAASVLLTYRESY